MDNDGITFDGVMDGGVLISIPFADDTPKAIKNILYGNAQRKRGNTGGQERLVS